MELVDVFYIFVKAFTNIKKKILIFIQYDLLIQSFQIIAEVASSNLEKDFICIYKWHSLGIRIRKTVNHFD